MPGVKIVLGGQLVTRCYDTMIKHEGICRYFDYLALWDGEEPLCDIHRKEIRGEIVDFVNVIETSSRRHRIDRQAKAPGPRDIPSPNFNDYNLDDYFFPEMLIPVQTTRGCYGRCEFCAIPFGSNTYRIRPAEKIIDDFIKIQEETEKKYRRKATYFKFMEDTSSPRLLYDISVEIERRNLNIKWETFARLEKAFTKKGFMDQLFRGGCRKIHWGLESNDPNILMDMNKKITTSYSDRVLELAAEAGILNFCFIIVGFPGETDQARESMIQYIINNKNIHTITPTTFDLTRGAPMQQNFREDNPYGMQRREAEGFEVRLPYLINGENWKGKIIPQAHELMLRVVRNRPDIGFMTLFPDQIRSMFCEEFTNQWGRKLVDRYGQDNIREMLLNTENYIQAYNRKQDINPGLLPEPLRREHFRTKEDMRLIAASIMARKDYEHRRFDQV